MESAGSKTFRFSFSKNVRLFSRVKSNNLACSLIFPLKALSCYEWIFLAEQCKPHHEFPSIYCYVLSTRFPFLFTEFFDIQDVSLHFLFHKVLLRKLEARSSMSLLLGNFCYHYKSLMACFIYLIYSVLKHFYSIHSREFATFADFICFDKNVFIIPLLNFNFQLTYKEGKSRVA